MIVYISNLNKEISNLSKENSIILGSFRGINFKYQLIQSFNQLNQINLIKF